MRERKIKGLYSKYHFFLHLTAWLACCGYLVVLGILFEGARPWVVVPVLAWTALLLAHAWSVFGPPAAAPVRRRRPEGKDLEYVEEGDPEKDRSLARHSRALQGEASRIMKTNGYARGIQLLGMQGSPGEGEDRRTNADQ